MQLLASAVPGLRDLRAPLVAGYIWLLCAWVLVQPETPLSAHVPSGPMGSFVQLAHTAGPVATAAGVSVVAYLVGAVSVAIPRAVVATTEWLISPAFSSIVFGSTEISLGGLEQRVDEAESRLGHGDERKAYVQGGGSQASPGASERGDRRDSPTSAPLVAQRPRKARRARRGVGRLAARIVPERLLIWGVTLETVPNVERLLSGAIETGEGEARRPDDQRPRGEDWEQALLQLAARLPVRPPALEDVVDLLRSRGHQLTREQMVIILNRMLELPKQMRRELNLPSTLLVGDQPEVYAEADRGRAEAEFRLAVVAPLVALSITMAVEGGRWWLLTIVAPCALLL